MTDSCIFENICFSYIRAGFRQQALCINRKMFHKMQSFRSAETVGRNSKMQWFNYRTRQGRIEYELAPDAFIIVLLTSVPDGHSRPPAALCSTGHQTQNKGMVQNEQGLENSPLYPSPVSRSYSYHTMRSGWRNFGQIAVPPLYFATVSSFSIL